MNTPLMFLTAAEVMSRNVILVPQDMSLKGAARLLLRARVSGAPVVDDNGRCVGVLSTTDFLHWVEDGSTHQEPVEAVYQPWHICENRASPTDTVQRFMTADPVVVAPGTRIGALAQKMMDAHIHRVIVVDAEGRPIGIVSSTDILAAVARESIPAQSERNLNFDPHFSILD